MVKPVELRSNSVTIVHIRELFTAGRNTFAESKGMQEKSVFFLLVTTVYLSMDSSDSDEIQPKTIQTIHCTFSRDNIFFAFYCLLGLPNFPKHT